MEPETDHFLLKLDRLRERWGPKAIVKGAALHAPLPPLATTFTELDALLGGGLPRGAITEITGRGTCGAIPLAYATMAAAQAEGETVTYLDIARTFDPFVAEAAGVTLKSLLLVYPDHLTNAMKVLEDLTREGASGLVVVNDTAAILAGWQGPQILYRALQRLTLALRRSPSAIVFLSPTVHTPDAATHLTHSAAVRLQLQGKQWLWQAGEIVGYQAQARIAKAHHHAGKSASVTFFFLS